MDEIIQIITQVGFPIAACVAVWLDGRKREDKLMAMLQLNTEAMSQTSAALERLTDAINNKEV